MNFKKKLFQFIMLFVDIILMYSSLIYILSLRIGNSLFSSDSQVITYLFYFFFIHLVWLVYLFLLNFYEMPPLKEIYEFFSNLAIFVALALSTAAIIFYFQIKVFVTPKTILLLDVLIVGTLIFLWRALFKWLLRFVNFSEKILIVGSRIELEEMTPEVLQKNRYDIIFYKPAGKLNYFFLKEKITENGFDSIVLAFDFHEERNLVKEIFTNLPVGLNYVDFSSFYESLFKKVPLDSIDELWFLENLRKKGKFYDFCKRIFDIVFSFLGLVITTIVLIPVILIIKIGSPGSLFYKQKRVGKDGKEFVIYKFRTMKVSPEVKDPSFVLENESRIIPLGRLLRFTHLDELPQFYNILKGDISFVGPRPEWREFVEVYRKMITFYDIRSLIKPGLTGWAQIKYHNGATVDEVKEKLKYDLYYMRHHSFAFDLAIILRTVSRVISQDLGRIIKVLYSSIREKAAPTEKQKLQRSDIDILIADDEKIIQDTLSRFLRNGGYNTFLVSNGAEALDIVNGNRVKLAIVDIRMPGSLDGLQTLRQIKKKNSDIAVIMMTGYGNQETRQLSLDFGACAYLEKPFELADIKRCVEGVLSKEENFS